jgi:hypothetical protein
MTTTIEIAQNQLILFDMLTVEQEIELARRVKQATFEADTNEKRLNEIIKLLSDKGFTDRHFKYEINDCKITTTFNVNNRGGEPKHIETEIRSFTSQIHLLYSKYDKTSNSIGTVKRHFWVHNGKIECSSLTGNYRYYKPESILSMIEKSYGVALNQYNEANKLKSNIEYTVNKYKELYPEATITVSKDYLKGGEEFDKVTVKFKSGSYVSFKINENSEYLVAKFDAVFNKLKGNDILDYFNTQETH